MIVDILVVLVDVARIVAAAAFALSLIIAATHWAVRSQRINAFGGWARGVRRISDPILRPVELQIKRFGGNPQDAPWWLVGIAIVGGLILIALVRWIVSFAVTVYFSGRQGLLVPALIMTVFQILKWAIIAEVLASWIGLSPYSRGMRIVHALTDWLLNPIRRVVPTLGMFDISPLIGYLLLSLAESLVMRGGL